MKPLLLCYWCDSYLTVHVLIHIFKSTMFLLVTPNWGKSHLTIYARMSVCMASVYMQRSRHHTTVFRFIMMGYNVTPFTCDCYDLRSTVHTFSHSANVTPISQKSQTSECTLTRISTSSETWLEAERFGCFVLSPYSKGLSDGEGSQRHYYAKLQQL